QQAARALLHHDYRNDSTASRMRSLYALHLCLSVAIPAIQPRLRLSGTNRLRSAFHGGQRWIILTRQLVKVMDIDIALNVTTAILFMGVLGLLLSSMLAFANKKLWLFEDPCIDDFEGMLPAANCGTCGNAGCRPFAEALISSEVTPTQRTISSSDAIDEIADYLGVDAGDVVKQVA
ncbi:MAG: hypothetical protein KZQ63_17440, partial [Candidatus Thiodiazotropha sp. (ex Lucinoma aequizonata)]|nr:hypothetical protein [Candidatus Thiodiazotropha sp. (ex Lucinoma aequizonata)]